MKKKIERVSKLQEQIIFLLGVNHNCNHVRWIMPRSIRGDFDKAKIIHIPREDFHNILSMNKKQLIKIIIEEVFFNSNPTKALPSILRSLDNLERKKYISIQEVKINEKKEKEVTITKKGMKLFLKNWLEIKPFAEIYRRMMDTIKTIPRI
jgi:hypothetical protein